MKDQIKKRENEPSTFPYQYVSPFSLPFLLLPSHSSFWPFSSFSCISRNEKRKSRRNLSRWGTVTNKKIASSYPATNHRVSLACIVLDPPIRRRGGGRGGGGGGGGAVQWGGSSGRDRRWCACLSVSLCFYRTMDRLPRLFLFLSLVLSSLLLFPLPLPPRFMGEITNLGVLIFFSPLFLLLLFLSLSFFPCGNWCSCSCYS